MAPFLLGISRGLFLFAIAAKHGANPLTVEAGDVLTLDFLGALSLASIGVGAGTKTEFVHLADHLLDTILSFDLTLGKEGEVADLSRDEEHSGSILTSSYAGTATDASSSVHSLVGFVLGNEDGVGIGHATGGGADVTTSLDDLVKSGTVYNEVADDRECFGTPRLDPNFVAIVETTHMELAGGDAIVVTVRTTVDIKATHTANTLTTIVIEANGVSDMVIEQLLVEDVEHLQEGAVGSDIVDSIGLEATLGLGIFLTPDM